MTIPFLPKNERQGTFYICSNCGEIEWMEDSEYNELQSDGNIKKEVKMYIMNIVCFDCDTSLDGTNRVNVSKKLRKKVAKMKPEQRIVWLNEYRSLKKLEDKPNFAFGSWVGAIYSIAIGISCLNLFREDLK